MIESKKIDLSKVFRPHLKQSSDETSKIKEQFMEQKLSRIEQRAVGFLLDKRYVLNLDELI